MQWRMASLEFASVELRNDGEIVLEAVKTNGISLQFATKAHRDDVENVMEAVKNSPYSL